MKRRPFQNLFAKNCVKITRPTDCTDVRNARNIFGSQEKNNHVMFVRTRMAGPFLIIYCALYKYYACTGTDMIALVIPFKKFFTFRFWTALLRCTKTRIGGELWHSRILDAGVVRERVRIILMAKCTSDCANPQDNVTILLRWRIVRMQSQPIKECQGRSFLLIWGLFYILYSLVVFIVFINCPQHMYSQCS